MDPTNYGQIYALIDQGGPPLGILSEISPKVVTGVTVNAEVKYETAILEHGEAQTALYQGELFGWDPKDNPELISFNAETKQRAFNRASGILVLKHEAKRLSRGFMPVVISAGAVAAAAMTFWISSALSADSISSVGAQRSSTEQLKEMANNDRDEDYLLTCIGGVFGVGIGLVGADLTQPYYVRRRAARAYRKDRSSS